MSWVTTPVSLCQSNDLELEIQKRRYLKNVALDFAFGFETMPRPSCYLTSIIDKTYHGPVIALFFCATSAAFLATSEVFL